MKKSRAQLSASEPVTNEPKQAQPSRRKFLASATAGAAGAAALAFPMVSKAQAPIKLRFQAGWPTKDAFYVYTQTFVQKVTDMSGGKLVFDLLPAGSVVKPFDMLDAVHSGTLDAAHGACGYWYGKNSAYSLFGTGPAIGMDAQMLLGWVEYGGGKALYEELITQVMKYNVKGFLHVPMWNQPLGWFKKEVKTAADFKGLKYRTIGLAVDLMKEMGASVVMLPGAEIVPALERGLIDAAEFNNPTSDRILGFPDVSKICMVQSFHQPMECQEIIINKKKFDALPKEFQAIIANAASSLSAEMGYKSMSDNSRDMSELAAKGVQFIRTPKEILEAQLNAWDAVIAKRSAENPFFVKVFESQKAWVKRVGPWRYAIEPSQEMAYNHFFGKKA